MSSIVFLSSFAVEIPLDTYKKAHQLIVSFLGANFAKIISIHGKFMLGSLKKYNPTSQQS